MSDAVVIAAIAIVPATLGVFFTWREARGARQQATAANYAVNNVTPGEHTLVKKVDHFIEEVDYIRVDIDQIKNTLESGSTRLTTLEAAVAHVIGQVGGVKTDLADAHDRADAVPADAEAGAAADAAAITL